MRISANLNKILKLSLTVLTIALFIYYFIKNKGEFSHLKGLSVSSILLILLGQLTILASNVFMLVTLVKIVNKKMSLRVSSRIIAYSSLINFFGFLQGGLGFRGIYLKKYFGISLKTYTALTVLQYLSVFSVAIVMILTGLWLVHYSVLPILILLLSGFIAFIFKNRIIKILTKLKLDKLPLIRHRSLVLILLLFSAIQLLGSSVAYYVELQAVGAHFSFGALLIFTGVAQFAILVALTPGAIGIRESLLFLVQGLMAISSASIILAGTIDRLVYFILLLLITPFAMGFKKSLKSQNIETTDS